MALPEDAREEELDPELRRELRPLAALTAERVARHLVVAIGALEEDPATALAHTRAARALAGRIGVVREAAGLAAYRCGEYAEALAELRAARRISGSWDHLAVIADCERGLRRPDRALAAAAEPQAARLDRATRVELAIVVSGARRDLGQAQAAVLALQGRDLEDDVVHPWSVRLWYAYAEALLAAGRRDEALDWFTSAATLDEAGSTDAADRAAELSP